MDKSIVSNHPNLLLSHNSILVLVDMQTKLVAAMSEADAADMLNHTQRLLQAAKLLGIPVLVTEQCPEKLGATVLAISENVPDNSQWFAKSGFSCTSIETFNLALAVSQCQHIILCGLESHVCILQTALELTQSAYQVYIVEDAVCSRRIAHKTNALQRLQQQGITLVNHESVLFEWLKTADHIHFKAISSLLR